MSLIRSFANPSSSTKESVEPRAGSKKQPALPSEILLKIIRQATYVHELLNKQEISPFARSRLTDATTVGNAILESEETKSIVEAVCREWKAMSAPFVHEYLYVGDHCNWELHASLLEKSKTHAGFPKNLGAGAYIRRIDFDTSAWDYKQIISAVSILQCCSKLESLTLGGDNGAIIFPYQLLNALLQIDVSFLHTLSFQSTLPYYAVHAFIQNAHRFKSLDTLAIRFMDFYIPRGIYMSVSLEKLTILELLADDASDLLHLFKDWKFSSLRRLTLHGQSRVEREGTLSFFRVHGGKLRIFEFDYLADVANDVLSLCPHLTEITLDAMVLHLNDVTCHPSVERVGLRGLARAMAFESVRIQTLRCFESFFPILLDKDAFPRVSIVRLLDYDQENFEKQGWSLDDTQRWKYWIQRFEEVGMLLEDHEGRAVGIDIAVPEDLPGGWRFAESADSRATIDGVRFFFATIIFFAFLRLLYGHAGTPPPLLISIVCASVGGLVASVLR